MGKLFFLLVFVGFLMVEPCRDNKLCLQNKTVFVDSVSQGDIALKFINKYVENCNKKKDAIDIEEWVNANKLVTDDFKIELKRIITEAKTKNPDLGLSYNPIFDAQDYPGKGFVLESLDKLTNYVVVKGIDWNEFRLRIKVKRIGDIWYVDGCGVINIPKEQRIKRKTSK